MAGALPWKTVWVTGASSGIGREICSQLSDLGVTVAASARSAERLASIGLRVHPYPLDVTKKDDVSRAAEEIENRHGRIDLALFAAGTYSPVIAGELKVAPFEEMMRVNYLGVVHGLAAVVPRMVQRRAGHVAWIASVAGYRGLPKAAAYGPSKAALINLGESLRPELARSGVIVSVVNPGFVETPMTAQNDFPMPFLMKPDKTARLTISGLAKGRFEISYPWAFVAMLKIGRMLPYSVYFRLIDRGLLKD
jgi:short-subunit dehydrogenase